jgi:putative ABC transport system permease protein
MPLAQNFLTGPKSLYVRTSVDPLAIAGAIRKIITRDHSAAIGRVQTLEDEMSIQIAPRRFQAALLGTFATLSLVLAMVGTYGVLSYAVTERTREVGIRMALGADRRDVFGMVIVRSGKLVCAAVGLGLLGAFTLTRVMGSLIYGVKPTDSGTYVAVCSILAGLALLASYVPARRAMQLDPIGALRHE